MLLEQARKSPWPIIFCEDLRKIEAFEKDYISAVYHNPQQRKQGMISDERLKELMAQVGMPDSTSLMQAFKQCDMEARLDERLAVKADTTTSLGHADAEHLDMLSDWNPGGLQQRVSRVRRTPATISTEAVDVIVQDERTGEATTISVPAEIAERMRELKVTGSKSVSGVDQEQRLLKGGIFIGGPSFAAIVYDEKAVEPVIKALAEVSGDDEDDYTATVLQQKKQGEAS
jgi:hypothetical protein